MISDTASERREYMSTPVAVNAHMQATTYMDAGRTSRRYATPNSTPLNTMISWKQKKAKSK